MLAKTYFRSDSIISLLWIEGEPSQWMSFVGNSVSEIQQLTDKKQWNHVRSEQNSADLMSRRMEANMMGTCDLWWRGPDYLIKPSCVFKAVWSYVSRWWKIYLEYVLKYLIHSLKWESTLQVFSRSKLVEKWMQRHISKFLFVWLRKLCI